MIYFRYGAEPSAMAEEALSAAFAEQQARESLRGKTILLKPNVGRVSRPGTGVCTNPEIVRGAVRAAKALDPARILVGDGPIWGVDIHEALEQTGIAGVCREEGVECVDLDGFGFEDVAIPSGIVVKSLRFSALVRQADCIVSIPVMKTHMYTGVSLSIKNMKGCLYKMEKTKLHRINRDIPDPGKGRVLDYGIADMAAVLMPHYALMDGTTGMEGLGPSVGTPRQVGVALASADAPALDFASVRLMGMQPDAVPHLNLIREALRPELDPLALPVDTPDYVRHAVTFEPASLKRLGNEYPHLRIIEQGACSACSAALMVFVRTHGGRFPDKPMALGTGKDLKGSDLLAGAQEGEQPFCIGNCAAGAALELGQAYCKGCPPVGSSILAHIMGDTLDEE